ncbi:fatty acyl-CoA reductase 2-like [Trachypithecus francoisi]|uniref:fatty acyl-CoA reductase 2-like n=1 Tax=Trachypithecus francoisi TaxID=54180 RepID=UPI00141BCEEC|nr:fatty acyl-CoA reductase 2-like [Trachypithecus francoisi]
MQKPQCNNHATHGAIWRKRAPAQEQDNAVIDEITPKQIGNWPNTKTYTKALGEMVVQQESRNLTIAIIRPSIVVATWHKPFPDRYYFGELV